MASSHCFSNPPKHNSSISSGLAGKEEQIGGLQAYVTGPPQSHRAVLMISDVYGYEAPILRKVADKVGEAGFFVVVPDFFFGDPVIDPNRPGFDREGWIKAHDPIKGAEDAKPVIAALKSQGVSAVGAAGFCWGGLSVVKLGSCPDLIQAAVVLHPMQTSKEDIREVRVPTALLVAENDQYFPPEDQKQLGVILAHSSQIDHFFKVYPGVDHGWTTRYDPDDKKAVKEAEEAHTDMLNWFKKHVK